MNQSEVTAAIVQALQRLGEENNCAESTRRVLPTLAKETIIGVRTPALRSYAKQIAGSVLAEHFLSQLPHYYYEENLLHALLLNICQPIDRALAEVNRLLPYVDNWAVCDALSPKCFGRNKDLLRREIERWLCSEQTFTVRFGVDMLMKHFLEEHFEPKDIDIIAAIDCRQYYVSMAVAWYVAEAVCKQRDHAIELIRSSRLDVATHNRAIRKAIESFRVAPDDKLLLRQLVRTAPRNRPLTTEPINA